MFAGTPEFALASLTALVDSRQVPVAVLTQPDRPAGRGKRLTSSPVKKYAELHGIPLLQPATLRDEDTVAILDALRPEVIVVAAYGLLLPQKVLDIPRAGCVNVHASLLPRWRGAAPIQAAILAADATTGVSLMSMTAGLDCGPVFCEQALDIAREETAGELHDRLAALGGSLLAEKLPDILAGNITALPQDEANAVYAEKIKTSDAELDWNRPAVELQRQVRAYNPAPGAYFFAGDVRVKCWQASVDENVTAAPGTIVSGAGDGVIVACQSGGLRLESLQLPGKKRVTAEVFAAQLDLRRTMPLLRQ